MCIFKKHTEMDSGGRRESVFGLKKCLMYTCQDSSVSHHIQ